MTLLSRLFPRRPARNRKPARPVAKPRTASRLGVESLDDRVLMSATAAIQWGALYINADPGGSQIYVQNHPNAWGDLVDVRTGSPTGPVLYQNYLSEFDKLYFYGKGGNDTCVVDPALTFPTMLDGGAGNDLLMGGGGSDLIFGGPGNDSLQGGLGSDVLSGNDGNDALYGSVGADWYSPGDGYDVIHRNGNRVNVAPFGTNDVVVGLVNDKLTSMELSESGKMMVSQIGGLLTISGPTGAGFNIAGNWQSSSNAAGGLDFKATGPVTLLSALGGIPFGAPGVPITIHTKATSFIGAGEYSSAELGGFGIDTNGMGSPLTTFKQNYGLGITINQPGHQVGLSLGSGLADMDAPLNPAVPYFYYKGDTSGSLSLYGVNVSLPGSSVSGSIAFDPSDPMLFVRLEGLPYVSSLGFAASAKGNIPFNPVTDTCNVASLFGNLYLEGAVTLGDYPVLISGDMVLDLDANDDGTMAGLTSRDIGKILSGQKSLTGAGAAMSDIRLGANGAVTATLEKGPLSINMPLTEGAVQVTPAKVEFHGKSANMFENVPLLSNLAVSPAKFDVSGHFYPSTKAWDFSARATTASIGGFKATGIEDPNSTFTPGAISLSYNSTDDNLVAAAHLEAPGGLWGVDVSGTVDLETGDFTLTGNASFELDPGIFSLSINANATFKRVGGTVTFHSDMYAWFSSDSVLGFSVSGKLEAHIDVTVYSPWYFVFSGTGSFSGTLHTPGPNVSLSGGATINNDGLKIDMPAELDDLCIKW